MAEIIDFQKVEKKWQRRWEKDKAFEANDKSRKRKYYSLEQYPYPSGSGLHVGHSFIYTVGDIHARLKRMQQYEVLHPIGFDSFGLPAENAAIKARSHPKKFTDEAIKNFIEQMKLFGFSYDWSRMIKSHDPEYYRWDQWIFLKMLEHGLAYRKKAPVNFCTKCGTVLANEQVVNGKCWRHEETDVEVRHLEQWFFKTTKYAEELLGELDKLGGWPETIKTLQRNWIGKSEGAEVFFEVEGEDKVILVDAVHCLVDKTGNVNKELMEYLGSLPNRKIVVTNASRDKHKKLFANVDFDIFTLEGEPNKRDSKYFRSLLDIYNLNPSQILYFDHSVDNVKSAQSIGIESFDYNEGLVKVKSFIESNLNDKWKVFTTRPDTLFGVTFLVVSAQHDELMSLVTADRKKEVDKFLKKIKSTKEEDIDKLEKEGVFSGSYTVHPLTLEKIPIWIGNFVVADYGSGMVMGVPAHDERDFAFAKKYGLEVKQVVAPIFITKEGKDAVKEDKPKDIRDSVFAIIKHWKEDKYLCLDWKRFNWRSLIIGGVDKNEKSEDAAVREAIEETGYSDIRSVKEIGFENHGYYYAEHKGVNRYAKFRTFLIELKSGKKEDTREEDTINHDAVWIDRDKVEGFLNLANNKYVWEVYTKGQKAFTDYGVLINSGEFDGLKSEEAKEHIVNALEMKGLGGKKKAYRLRDWLVSRQRFWGTPIPIIYCEKCGVVPVPEKDLPVKLPDNLKFEGVENPLKKSEKFLRVKCPKCDCKARRETDTMDTFVNSSWYFLRFCDPHNSKKIFDSAKVNHWMPIDMYVGGKEHAVLHDIYFRFYTKFLRDIGLLDKKIGEPALALFNQGFIHGEDGRKMSKSFGNVVLLEDAAKKYGVDSVRLFLVSVASPGKDMLWSDKGAEGSLRFLLRVMNFGKIFGKKKCKLSKLQESKLHRTIRDYTSDLESFRYNLAVIKLRALFDVLEEGCDKKSFEIFLKLLSPICPHIAEELWSKLGNKKLISLEKWPSYDEKKIDDKLEQAEGAIEKTIDDVKNILKIVLEKSGKKVERVYLYVLPSELERYNAEKLSKRIGLTVEVFAVNDSKKHDPEGKSKKVKPGRPGIYVE